MPYKKLFFVLTVVILAFSCNTGRTVTTKRTTAAGGSSSSISLSSMESGILAEVNRHRKSRGLKPLVSNAVVETEASLHSQRMASKKVAFGHSGYDARVSRINKRLGGVNQSAENVAYGRYTAREVVQAWLRSAPHRRNIEGKYNITGIGVSRDSRGTIYYTQLFTMKY